MRFGANPDCWMLRTFPVPGNLISNQPPMNHSISDNVAFQNRRHFLKVAGALAIGTTACPTLLEGAAPEVPGSAPKRPAISDANGKQAPIMQIGILLSTFVRPPLEVRLDAAKAAGLQSVQMSLDCAGLPAMPDEIPARLADRIRRETSARGITVASLGGTFNMSHPDVEHRQTGLRRLRVLAGLCKELAVPRIHICSGTRDRVSMWRNHPDNALPATWKDMVVSMREATDIAREAGVVVAFEPEVNNVIDSAAKARRLLDEIGSPHLKVTMDAANLFHAGELPRMSEILDEAFALVGKDIVMAHAKDLDHDGDAGHKAAGEGKLDYTRYLSLLHKYGFTGPIFLHGLSEAQVPGCVAFLHQKLALVTASPDGRREQ